MAGQAVAVELQPVMSGLTNRLYLTDARDGSVRLFVVEQAGVIKVLAPGGHPDGVPRHQEPIAVPSAPGEAGVRVWEVTSRERGPRTGRPPPKAFMSTIL